MSPGWNAAKPSGAGHQKNAAEMPLHPQCRCSLYSPFAGKRAGFGDRTAPSSTSGAAGAPQPAKGDVKVSHAQSVVWFCFFIPLCSRAPLKALSNPFAALSVDSPTADAEE
jgi:hypothetical protein